MNKVDSKRENEYQAGVIKKLKDLVKPIDGEVIKLNPKQIQGIPDWEIIANGKYALLEIKRDKDAGHRPNQDYYIEKHSKRGAFTSFMYPENEEQVISGLKKYFDLEDDEK